MYQAAKLNTKQHQCKSRTKKERKRDKEERERKGGRREIPGLLCWKAWQYIKNLKTWHDNTAQSPKKATDINEQARELVTWDPRREQSHAYWQRGFTLQKTYLSSSTESPDPAALVTTCWESVFLTSPQD